MNLLLIIVLIILIWSIYRGYRKGFVQMLFSLISIVIAIVFVSYATPYICTYIEENTSVKEQIESKCLSHIENSVKEEVSQTVEDTAKTNNETISGIQLPDNILTNLVDSGVDLTNQKLEESGVYESTAGKLAHFIVLGISFFGALIIILILLRVIAHLLKLFTKLPVLHGIDRFFGMVAGMLKGLLGVWLLFYIVAISCTSSFGLMMLDEINQSIFLSYLYNNKLLLVLLMKFFG